MACKKREWGDGCIVQLEKDKPRSQCRKWQLRLSLGKDAETGKYVKKTRVMAGTYQQACSAIEDFRDECERGLPRPAHSNGDLCGIALACSQIRGAMQLLGDFAEDKGDDRYWALVGSLDAALAIIEPLKEQA